MSLYMTQFAYTAEAWKALVKKPEDRAAVFAKQAEQMGGRMVSHYYCMGEYDGLFTVISPGRLKATRTRVLMSVEDAVEAMRRANAEASRGRSSVRQCLARALDGTLLSGDRGHSTPVLAVVICVAAAG